MYGMYRLLYTGLVVEDDDVADEAPDLHSVFTCQAACSVWYNSMFVFVWK